MTKISKEKKKWAERCRSFLKKSKGICNVEEFEIYSGKKCHAFKSRLKMQARVYRWQILFDFPILQHKDL